MEFSLKLPKATKIKYLEANEKKSRYRLTYSEVSKLKKDTIDVFEARRQHER